MKAAIFNPYFDTLGGGERYTAGIISVLNERGYEVDVQWHEVNIISKIKERFGVNISANVVPDIHRGDGYDVCFWISDGSVPSLRARKNFLHFQVPFKGVGGRSLINKMKLWRVIVIVNSEFTKTVIDREYGVDSKVLYPPIDTKSFKPRSKEKIILYVGRFSNLLQSKRQDFLIDSFKKIKHDLSGWQLVLAGGVEIGAEKVVAALKKQIQGAPVKIVESPSFDELVELNGKASIYWSASGYEVDTSKHPEQMEHFGMTLVEAMSAKAVPIVFNGGGYKEIVSHGKNGALWDTQQELIQFTRGMLSEKQYMEKLAKEARISSRKFDTNVFTETFSKLLN